jgi:glycosyltransferase involved in cell wall biosynthesis
MRYVWDQQDAYFGPGRASWPVRSAMRWLAPRLREWNRRTAAGVHRFVANSRHVADRIGRCFGREAVVIHPPVDLARFAPRDEREDYYLMLGAPAPYKRVDLAIDACRRLGRRLLVAGYSKGLGSTFGRIPPGRTGPVSVLGYLSEEQTAEVLARARALLLPGVEDFGIVVVEALASGTPVIAFGEGGVVDTVTPLGPTPAPSRTAEPPTGVFFHEPTGATLADAIQRFEAHDFDRDALVASAQPFAKARFLERMKDVEADLLADSAAA